MENMMQSLYGLLEGVLTEIENGLNNDINDHFLADKFNLSQVHLSRLFKFAFNRTIGAYIRSRRLSASVMDLLHTNLNVLDVALEYGFRYEQSFIRAFKLEFGITPGDLRKSGQILKITPPLQLFDSNKLTDGLIFGPDIAIVPEFHVIGKRYKSSFRDALVANPRSRVMFLNDSKNIPNAVNPNVFMNINSKADTGADYAWFMPAVQVKTLDVIPEGFDSFTFPASLCACFRFVGPGYSVINMAIADGMFKAIDDFMDNEDQKYFLERKRINFDRFDISAYDGLFCQWEWFAPVVEKTKHHVQMFPDGIIKTYKQNIPALRFIGKKITASFNDSGFNAILSQLDNARLNGMFDVIEKIAGNDIKTLYEGNDAYISLIRKTDNKNFEYWLGMFTLKNTGIPDGYEMIDFPKSTLGICRVYGKRNTIIHYDADCRKKLAEEGVYCQEDGSRAKWFFQRFNWRTFFEDDNYGKRILEYGYFI